MAASELSELAFSVDVKGEAELCSAPDVDEDACVHGVKESVALPDKLSGVEVSDESCERDAEAGWLSSWACSPSLSPCRFAEDSVVEETVEVASGLAADVDRLSASALAEVWCSESCEESSDTCFARQLLVSVVVASEDFGDERDSVSEVAVASVRADKAKAVSLA